MHEFKDKIGSSAMSFWLQVKNGARYSAILLLVGAIIGINLGFVIDVAKKVAGKSETCCPCFTDKEIEREAWLMRIAIAEMAARYGSTPPADTAGALNDSSSVKDTAGAETSSKAP